MQVKIKSSWTRPKTALFLIIVLVLSFLPVASFLFFLKNDAFNGYFPSRFFISESLRSEHFPWWNPYINYGLPQYGDMNSGFWSPFTWLVALSSGYNAYSFTIELLFYLLVAGSGMFTLCKGFRFSGTVAAITGIAFMCSGYMVGHLQHFNWISGASFLPWCLWSFRTLQKRRSLKNIIRTALFFYFLVASAHPGIIIGSIYFFIAYLLFSFFTENEEAERPKKVSRFVFANGSMIAILLLLSAGMLSGYADILPHFTRGEKVAISAALENPFSLPCFLSFILPLATVKMDSLFHTDISMRNAYIGLPLLIFFSCALFQKKSTFQKFFLYSGLFFLLLSLGGIARKITYHFFPGMSYVRLNGEFMICCIFCMLLVAASAFDAALKRKQKMGNLLKRVIYFWIGICGSALVVGLIQSFGSKRSIFLQMNQVYKAGNLNAKLKAFIDGLHFFDCLWIQATIQMLFLILILWFLQKRKVRYLVWVAAMDLILATLLHLPFTGVGQTSVSKVQEVLNQSPKGIPIPMLQPMAAIHTIHETESALVGDWSFYNKQLGTSTFAFYPVELNETKNIYSEWVPRYISKPYVFIEGSNDSSAFNILAFSGNQLGLSVSTSSSALLVYKQHNYPHWTASINKQQIAIKPNPFLSIPLQKGNQEVWFRFDPFIVRWMMWLSISTGVLCIFLLAYLTVKQSYLSSRRQRPHP